MAIDKKQLWIGWTHDAAAKFVMPERMPTIPDDDDDDDDEAAELVDEMVAFASDYASAMLEEYERVHDGKKRKKRKQDDDEDEDD